MTAKLTWTKVDNGAYVLTAKPIYAGVSRRGRGEWKWHISREYVALVSGTKKTRAEAMAMAKREFLHISRTFADEIAARA